MQPTSPTPPSPPPTVSPRAHQAILLAAGEGRRLSPITDTLPKPLVPFFGRPLIEWALDALITAGVTRIAVNAFHLADALAAHLDALRPVLPPHLELHLSREPTLLGTGGAIAHLRHWLTPGAPFFVLNADAVFAAPLHALAAHPAPALLVTREPAFAHERRLLASDGLLAALDERSHPQGFTFCGVTLADPGLPSRLPASGPSCVLRQGFLPSLDAVPVHLVETDDFFADTGTPESLVDAHRRGLAWVATREPPLRR